MEYMAEILLVLVLATLVWIGIAAWIIARELDSIIRLLVQLGKREN